MCVDPRLNSSIALETITQECRRPDVTISTTSLTNARNVLVPTDKPI